MASRAADILLLPATLPICVPFVSVRVRNARTEEPNYGDEHSSMRQTKLFYTSFRHFRDAFFRALIEADTFGWLWRRIKVVSYAFNLRCALNSIGALRQEALDSYGDRRSLLQLQH